MNSVVDQFPFFLHFRPPFAAKNLNESSISNTNVSTLSSSSTVDMNSTVGGSSFNREGDDSEVSQDSISLYLDDEKNTSM